MRDEYGIGLRSIEVGPLAIAIHTNWRSIPMCLRIAAWEYYHIRLEERALDLPAGRVGQRVKVARLLELAWLRRALRFLYGMRFDDAAPTVEGVHSFESLLGSTRGHSQWYTAWNEQCSRLKPSDALNLLAQTLDRRIRLHAINGRLMQESTLSSLYQNFRHLEEISAGLKVLEQSAARLE